VIFTRKKNNPTKGGKGVMRKMPVLTMVCLVAFGLAVVPSYAATTAANDTPDIVLKAGEKVSFDLADFFSSASALTYTAVGATVAGSVVTVDGSSPTATFTAGGVSLESEVVVSSFIIGNGPAVDDNNRIVGKDGGNIFYNPLVKSGVIKSVVNLTGLPAVGGAGTQGGQTDVAALLTSVAKVELSVSDTNLVQASRTLSTTSGLTPKLNQDGSYSVTADANFAGTWLVTLGASDGAGSKDAVHLLAAEAVAVDVKTFGTIPAGSQPAAALANGVVTAKANEGILAYGSPIVVGEAGDVVSLVADYNTTGAANVALVLFDGGLGANLAYCNPSGANIQVGKTKNLSMSMVTFTGTVIPAFQVVAGAAGATVTISNMAVVKAGPVTDYALNPNATVYESDLASVAGWGAMGGTAPIADTANNFNAAGTGCMKLPGAGGLSNALMTVNLPQGTASAECYAKVSAGTGAFAIALTDGGALSSVSFQTLTANWAKVIAVATPGAAQSAFLVVQASGFDALVDDICVSVVEDQAAFADLSLLGL
jgi:hypothetical protein